MKKVILLVCLLPCLAFGQIVENFEQGNLINWTQGTDARWKADTSESLSGGYSLHHIFDNPDSGTDQIGISTSNLHPSEGTAKWSFFIRHGYDPSSSNNWAVFLMSDTGPSSIFTDGNTNGYALGVNLTGYDDTLRLWKVKGNAVTTVVNTRINWQSRIGAVNAAKITAERKFDGNWTISVYSLSGELLNVSGGNDNEFTSGNWFVLSFKYSSSRDRMLWFDDLRIEGIFYEDDNPPEITGCETFDKSGLRITLSDQPDDNFLNSSNFELNPGGNTPVSVVNESVTAYILKFSEAFVFRSPYTLTIKKLCNRNGNCLENIRVPFTPFCSETGDIIISEIMADPEPVVSLPGVEYIEITNRTEFSYNLKNWRLSSGDQDYIFPETNLNPYGILILCPIKDTTFFPRYGKVSGLKQFPSLTDNGKLLLLYDNFGKLIHGVDYMSEWYGDELKSKGGWSLEIIDKRYPFYSSGNWRASISFNGGTPGTINSVAGDNPDDRFDGNLTVFPEDSLSISVSSQEPLFDFPQMTSGIRLDGICPEEIVVADPLFRKFKLKLTGPLERRKTCQLEISDDIKDFAGNKLNADKFPFGLTEPARPGNILFNELLFNALPGDPDYIELYNSSDKIIDASRLGLVSVNDASGDTSQVYLVSDEHRCILPGQYFAVTSDISRVAARYFSADFCYIYPVGSLPSMPDDKGHLILFSRELVLIDEVYYNENMQSSLLSGSEGVALEKINPRNKSVEPENWHSASESSGWGTPGAANSVFSETPSYSDKVHLSSGKITPNEDGYEDLLIVSFNLSGNTNVISVTIFDESGNYVRKVAENLYAGQEASVIWDATGDDGSMVDTGIYIVLITVFDESGKTNKWKKVCTVIRK
jgi:hypothetical protein